LLISKTRCERGPPLQLSARLLLASARRGMRRMASSCGVIVQGDGFCSRPANLFQWQTATDTNPKDQRAKNAMPFTEVVDRHQAY
jgi:hypothetical protein